MPGAPAAYLLRLPPPEEIGMNPGTSWYDLPSDEHRDPRGVAWASVIAILFAAVAAISFAVDQSVTLSSLP
jgi:hypothetical protein